MLASGASVSVRQVKKEILPLAILGDECDIIGKFTEHLLEFEYGHDKTSAIDTQS